MLLHLILVGKLRDTLGRGGRSLRTGGREGLLLLRLAALLREDLRGKYGMLCFCVRGELIFCLMKNVETQARRKVEQGAELVNS